MIIMTQAMKEISVLLYHRFEPYPKQGGMERITDSLARGLKNKGINVILLCKEPNALGGEYDAPAQLYYLPQSKEQEFILNLIEKHSITHIIDQTMCGIVGMYGVFEQRSALPSDITLIAAQHNSAKAILDNYKIAMHQECRNKVTQLVFDNMFLPVKKLHSIYHNKKLYKNQYQNYDKIVLLSESFISEFRYFYKQADRTKLLSIPNMNSFDTINHTKKLRRILFVGRLVSNVKGCDKLLRIWQKILKETEGWHLDIVGNGPDRAKLENYAKKLGLKDYTFHGNCDPKPFYERSKILCMCSIYEGYGLVLTEAMQHGAVPIAFNSFSSVKDIIVDGETGFIINPFDEVKYAKTLIHLMNDNTQLNIIRKNAELYVEKFSPENIMNQWIDLLIQTTKLF